VEAHLFGDKPVYVTNAYRKHQEEQANYEAELDKKCAGPPVPSACSMMHKIACDCVALRHRGYAPLRRACLAAVRPLV